MSQRCWGSGRQNGAGLAGERASRGQHRGVVCWSGRGVGRTSGAGGGGLTPIAGSPRDPCFPGHPIVTRHGCERAESLRDVSRALNVSFYTFESLALNFLPTAISFMVV